MAAVPIQRALAAAETTTAVASAPSTPPPAPVVRAEIAVAPTAPAAQPAPSASAPAPARASIGPVVQKYVVRQGDSIWKIFRALGRNANGESWKEFLSTTRSLNGLDDPDTIIPGRVLDLAPQGK